MKNETEYRALAAWRARACCAAVAVGASVFAVSAGVLIPIALNAAWLCALPAALLSVPAALLVRRRGRSPSRTRCALFGAVLLCACILLCAASVALAQQTLTAQSPSAFTALMTAAAVFACALAGSPGVSRLCFALRWTLPVLLIALCLQALPGGASGGLYPLLGAGADAVGLGALCSLGALTPVLLLALPVQDVKMKDVLPPPARFFAWRVGAGALCGVLLAASLSLCSDYMILSGMQVWGQRMRIVSSGRAGSDLFKALMTLLQMAALLLGAAACLDAARQSVSCALPTLAGRRALLLLALLVFLALAGLVYFGFGIALYAAPFLAIPALLAALGGRMGG